MSDREQPNSVDTMSMLDVLDTHVMQADQKPAGEPAYPQSEPVTGKE